MSLESLQKRLTTLQETTSHIQTLIARLASFKFQPGAVPLNPGSLDNAATELSNEIHDTLKEQNSDFELLEQQIKDSAGGRKGSDAETNKLRLIERATRIEQELKHARSAFRKAQLAAKRNLELSQRAEREILLQSLISPSPPSSSQPISRRRSPVSTEQTQDEKLVGSAGDVTAALRRTHAMMANELSRSQFAHDTLKESTAALDQLGESYTSLDSVLASTKSLLGMLLKSQKSDTWYLETAFYVLLATICWLVFRRFVYGPAWLLLYVPRKLLWYTWAALSTVFGLGGSSSGVSVSSPGVGTTIMTASGTAAQATMSGTGAPEIRRPGRGNLVPPVPPGEDEEDRRLVDVVGEMAENTREQSRGQEQEQEQPASENNEPQEEEEVQRNPKKRMWDADVEARKQEEQKKKDEL